MPPGTSLVEFCVIPYTKWYSPGKKLLIVAVLSEVLTDKRAILGEYSIILVSRGMVKTS